MTTKKINEKSIRARKARMNSILGAVEKIATFNLSRPKQPVTLPKFSWDKERDKNVREG
jgi:hypothetical protein